MVKMQTKTFKKGIIRKFVHKSDRDEEPRDNNATIKPNAKSRLTECEFFAVAKFDDKGWFLTINNPNSSHKPTIYGSYLVLQKMPITNEVKNTIALLSKT